MERSAKRRQGEQARSMEWGAKRRRTGGNDGTAGCASSTHTSTEGQEVATSLGYDYEVFLSFRGSDTRAGFTDFLCASLKGAGIRTFKDDEDLRKGVEFAPELLQAIKQSKILIPIFSKDYASSIWCLKEVAQMVECKKTGGKKIMPIFYDVAPSEVRHQIGNYEKSFLLHESKERYDQKTIGEWKDALRAVGEINGWELPREPTRREGEFAKEVTDEVFRELKKAYLAVSDCLVSVDNQVDEIKEIIGVQTSETRIIGIYGMGGIGKTTIAKITYNQLSSNFKNCCFLANIRETECKDIKCLQKQLISDILKEQMDINNVDEGTRIIKDRLPNKRVLLLLDDVEKASHIDAFVGKRDWFGKGSRIIITTRNKDILCFPKVDCSYELKCMDLVQSLKLFSKHAFRRDSPLDEDMNQSNRAIDIAKGLPLALEVIGSLLSRTEKKNWDLTLKKLENVPDAAVQSKLKISYDALDVRQQYIFLDIACLFIGYNKDIVIYFWDESKYPEEAMEVLQNMSLIKIEKDNKVWMHDQLRDLGREIVRQESNYKIEEQSRVWNPKEALDLLRRQKKKKKLEALCLHLDHQHRFAYEDFKRLPNLRFLEVCGSNGTFRAEERLLWYASPSNVFPTNEDSHLLPELQWLSWHDIPPTFNITIFSAAKVVILNLSQSAITNDWKGWNHVKMMENLKVMDLNNCNYLKRTPDFPAHSKLESLILQHCYRLVEIDKSICQLKRLVFLDVSYCRNLRRLPNTIGNLKSLKELDILDTRIKELPNSIGNLKSLIKLDISQMGFQELPDSIGSLESLIKLDISSNKIKELPESIGSLESLIELDISYTVIKGLPNSIGNFKSLVELNISSTGIKELPDSIGQLKNLKVVKMNYCPISKIPDALWTIEKLEVVEALADCPLDVKIGNHIYRNRSLRILQLSMGRIYVIPRLPESLMILVLSDLYMNTFPDLSNLTNLEGLTLWFEERDSDGESDGPVEKDLPGWIGNLSKLEALLVRSPYVTTLPTDISLLPQLESLRLWCPNLRCLPSLPSSLLSLDLRSKCVAALPTDMSSLLPQLKSLNLGCPNLCCLPSLPSSLSSLYLNSGCVTTLPMDMSSLLPQLQSLHLACPNLHWLPSLPSSLCRLYLFDCKLGGSMEGEDLSNLKTLSTLCIGRCAILEIRGFGHLENLQQLYLSDCGNLAEIQGELPSSLRELVITGCGSLQKLPDLSSLKGLLKVEIKGCGKLNVEEISLLCSERGVNFDYECGCEYDYKSEGEDDEFGCEFGYGAEGEDRRISARRS